MSTFQRPIISGSRKLPLYVDRKIVVINKPAGMVSQATSRERDEAHEEGDINRTQDAMRKALDDITSRLRLSSQPLLVHRLDRSTTGALLLARTPQAAKDLSQQFATRTVHKTYLALVRGGRKTFAKDKGDITAGLKFDDGRVSVSKSGKEALTTWELMESCSDAPLSLLRLTLHTGLKHQLRVHLAHILNAPVLGDALYSRSEVSDKILSLISLPKNRMFLHASHISFLRYRAWGQAKQFRLGITAPLPRDFVDICVQAGFTLDKLMIQGGVTVDGQPAPADLSSIQGEWVGPRPP